MHERLVNYRLPFTAVDFTPLFEVDFLIGTRKELIATFFFAIEASNILWMEYCVRIFALS